MTKNIKNLELDKLIKDHEDAIMTLEDVVENAYYIGYQQGQDNYIDRSELQVAIQYLQKLINDPAQDQHSLVLDMLDDVVDVWIEAREKGEV